MGFGCSKVFASMWFRTTNSSNLISMRNLTATLCLTVAVLLGSEVEGSDLPVCMGSPKEVRTQADVAEWDNCQGIYDLWPNI